MKFPYYVNTINLHHWSYALIESFAKIDLKWIKNADIIQTDYPLLSGMVGVLLKKIYNKPLVQNVPGDVYAEINQPLASTAMSISKRKFLGVVFRYIANKYTDFVFSNADRIVVDGPDLSKKLADHGVLPGKIISIPNGIDTDFFNPGIFQCPKFNFADLNSKKTVLFMGRLSEENGPLQFLEVMRSLKDVIGVVVGGGPLKLEMQNYVKENNMTNIVFTGMIPRNQVPSTIMSSDVCVFPLIRIGGVSMVVPEAMAMGKSVVTTDAGSNKKLIKHGETGFIAKINDVASMTDYVSKLLADSELRNRIGQRAREFIVTSWSWRTRIKEYEKVYSDIC